MTFAHNAQSHSPTRGWLTRLVKVLFPGKPLPELTELDRARMDRVAAADLYVDACRRNDTRDQNTYLHQFMKATNRVLHIEMEGGA